VVLNHFDLTTPFENIILSALPQTLPATLKIFK